MRKVHLVTASSILLILFLTLGINAADSNPVRVADLKCAGASLDHNVWWNGLHHDSFHSLYRKPFGAVPAGGGKVRLRFRTCAGDAESVRVRIWDDRKNVEYWASLHPISFPSEDGEEGPDPSPLGLYNYWEASVTIPPYPTILYYVFEVRDGRDVDFYVDDDIKLDGGGPGVPSETRDDSRSYQLTVYDPAFRVPDWIQGATVYQIFPDRFRNGNRSNDPVTGRGFIYGLKARLLDWASPLCDPLSDECPEERHNMFYGGDLAGITQKLGYLENLGVTAIYLNPIFRAPSNHKYDMQDPMEIDPAFGTSEDFEHLATEARKRGIRLILDGVFNHLSSDSPYFDYYNRWNASHAETSSEGPGEDDGSGACESPKSPYRSWFWLPHRHSAARHEAWGDLRVCPRTYVNEPHEWHQTYEAWFGYASLPKLNTWNQAVRDFIYAKDRQSVAPHWIYRGGAGWRLDVGGDVDPGLTQDPANLFWEEFRTAVKKASPDTVIIGEEWGDSSPWLLGHEWDSAMNYRFRSALLSWLADGCEGRGCASSGLTFEDNDSNDLSHSGPIHPIGEARFDRRLKSIQEDYPPQAWHAMLNLSGSHDTNRLRFLLKKISRDSDSQALRKHKFFALFQYTYPGAPTVYYGDEAGVKSEGVWDGRTWQDDPYNRVVYPWADQGLSPDTDLIALYRRLGELRKKHEVLRDGDYQTLLADDTVRTFAFARFHPGRRNTAAIMAFKRAESARGTLTLDVGDYYDDGIRLKDGLSDRTFTVSGGKVKLGRIDPLWGLILTPATGG